MPSYSIEHLRTPIAVLDEGTFDAAAASLHVTAAAVSQRAIRRYLVTGEVAGCRQRLQGEITQVHGVAVVEHRVGESSRTHVWCKYRGVFGFFNHSSLLTV